MAGEPKPEAQRVNVIASKYILVRADGMSSPASNRLSAVAKSECKQSLTGVLGVSEPVKIC